MCQCTVLLLSYFDKCWADIWILTFPVYVFRLSVPHSDWPTFNLLMTLCQSECCLSGCCVSACSPDKEFSLYLLNSLENITWRRKRNNLQRSLTVSPGMQLYCDSTGLEHVDKDTSQNRQTYYPITSLLPTFMIDTCATWSPLTFSTNYNQNRHNKHMYIVFLEYYIT